MKYHFIFFKHKILHEHQWYNLYTVRTIVFVLVLLRYVLYFDNSYDRYMVQ
jgi:hypothetical protein